MAEGAAADAAEAEIPVLAPAGEVVVARSGSVDAAGSVELAAEKGALGDQGKVTVVASGSPAVGIFSDLQSLIEYPHGCSEQPTSRLVPLVIVRDLARASGAALPPDLDGAVHDTVERLAGHQQFSGWFGLWPTSKPDAWVTAYVLGGLRAVRERGVAVPPGVIERAVEGLARHQKFFEQQGTFDPDSPAILEAISGSQPGPVSSWKHLFEVRSALPLPSRATLLRGLARAGLREEAALLGDEIAPAILALDERASVGRFDSKDRLVAMLLRGRLAQGHPQADALAKALAEGRRGGRYRSTQDSAAVLLALDEYFKGRPGSLEAGSLGVSVQGDRRSLGWGASGSAASTWPLSSLSSGARVELVPSGKAYHEIWLRYLRAEQPSAPHDEGILLQRSFSPAHESTLEGSRRSLAPPADRFTLGATVIVSATFELRGSTRDLALTIPVPAGLEILGSEPFASCAGGPWVGPRSGEKPAVEGGVMFHTSFEHCEMRGDRAVFFLRESPAGVHRVSFATRASTVGHFHAPPAEIEAMYGPQKGASAGGGFAVVEPTESLALAIGAGG